MVIEGGAAVGSLNTIQISSCQYRLGWSCFFWFWMETTIDDIGVGVVIIAIIISSSIMTSGGSALRSNKCRRPRATVGWRLQSRQCVLDLSRLHVTGMERGVDFLCVEVQLTQLSESSVDVVIGFIHVLLMLDASPNIKATITPVTVHMIVHATFTAVGMIIACVDVAKVQAGRGNFIVVVERVALLCDGRQVILDRLIRIAGSSRACSITPVDRTNRCR